MKTIAIIQARMGSTRLPGKIMMDLCGKTVLDHVITRVKQAKELDEVVIATTIKLEDDVVSNEAKRLDVKCFRGSEEDVLSRYYYAAKENDAYIVIRITSDCPLVDPNLIDNIIGTYKRNRCDYISNTISRTYPRGFDIEIFSFNVLEKAFMEATEEYQREHVTPYIYENSQLFMLQQYVDCEDNSDLRCTLDTEEDYEAITAIFKNLSKNFKYKEVVNFLRENLDVVDINKDIAQKKLR